jgi:hypothetical protein
MKFGLRATIPNFIYFHISFILGVCGGGVLQFTPFLRHFKNNSVHT